MDYWRDPHSGIISATPGLAEYRQIHLAERNPGLWPATRPGARALVYLWRRADVGGRAFRKFVTGDLAPALAGTGALRELRTQMFLPWNEKLWDTPDVAHDNPADQRCHASVMLGFDDRGARAAFFASRGVERISSALAPHVSAIHAYDVSAALTYVSAGVILPHYRE
ncbi:hypothetical protein [Microbacterium sp. LWS13-1.2]|uniref:Strictosidine synthase n=1 Tax=Microbacterium sp. LWS13-1.2 TaxID=3135264 RepID=A0AAU6SDL5_9MICO